MQEFSVSPRELVASLWRNRGLIQVMVQRDVLGRYRGSFLGVLWSFFNPVFMLIIYTFVFSVVFKARWSVGSDSKTEFALALFAGLIVFNLFSEAINRAPTLILSNVNYVKKVVFPLEVLPWISLGSAFFHFLISLGVWLAGYVVLFGAPPVTTLYLPIVLLPLILMTMGLSWLIASLGVYMRDVTPLVSIITSVLMFLSPIFYPVSALPLEYQRLIFMNPLTIIIEQVRNVMFWGQAPNFGLLAIYYIVASIIAWLGFSWFQKTRKGFADVL